MPRSVDVISESYNKAVTALIRDKRLKNKRPGETFDSIVGEYMPRVQQCSLGSHHALFVDDQSNVWLCGYNRNAELADADRELHISKPELAPFKIPSGVKHVLAGMGCSFFLSNAGEVYVCGRGAVLFFRHLLGDVPNGVVKLPIPYDLAVASLAIGDEHILVLTTDGRVFGYGMNEYHQMGVQKSVVGGTLETIAGLPDKKFKAIATGSEHSVFLTEEGDVYTCGYHYSGALGLGIDMYSRHIDKTKAQKVTIPRGEKCASVIAAARQTYVIAVSGRVYCWGSMSAPEHLPQTTPLLCTRAHREMGTAIFAPEATALPVITKVAVGDNFALFLTEGGRVFVTGYNNGKEDVDIAFGKADVFPFSKDKVVVDIDVKSGHDAVVVTDDGEVYFTPSVCKRLGCDASVSASSPRY